MKAMFTNKQDSLEDDYFMSEAIAEAELAFRKGEVPVGAVLVLRGKIAGRGHNLKETLGNPLYHAEMIAINGASGNACQWRLNGSSLYVTLEPCLMCMGAILQARISTLVFGARDPKGGACGSLFDLSSDKRLNHRVSVVSGVKSGESSSLLSGFFKSLREKKRFGTR